MKRTTFNDFRDTTLTPFQHGAALLIRSWKHGKSVVHLNDWELRTLAVQIAAHFAAKRNSAQRELDRFTASVAEAARDGGAR